MIQDYEKMMLIRVFEESLCPHIESGEISTPCHLYIGQEATAVGVCSNLNEADLIWGNHRSHGHYLAKGGDTAKLMDEIFCKSTGCSGGRGGSMHIIDKSKGIYGTVPIVAGTVALGIGSSLSMKLNSTDDISVVFIGDGATEEGHVIESINMAALYNLPTLFVIENNLYSSHMHMTERRREHDLQKIGLMHGVPTVRVDGNDVRDVKNISKEMIDDLRSGNGPAIIEAMTFRFRGHVGHRWDEDVGVKRKDELSEWLKKDPLLIEKDRLLSDGVKRADLDKVDSEILHSIEEMVSKARKASFPNDEDITKHVFSG